MFIDLKKVGYVLAPDEIGCYRTEAVDCDQTTAQQPLDPPETILGCHKTMADTTKRDFGGGAWDELAIWNKWINNTEKAYFLGGFSKSL